MTGSGHKILCLKRRATYYLLWYLSAHRKLSRSYAGNFTSIASRAGDEGGLAVPRTAFAAWQDHLATALGRPLERVDHGITCSLYLGDPDGNPYEITCYV